MSFPRAAAALLAVLVLFSPLPAHAISPPQQMILQNCTAVTDFHNTASCAPTNPVAQGDLIVVEVSSTPTPTVSDTQHNSFTLISSAQIPSSTYYFFVYVATASASGVDIISLKGTAIHPRMIVEDISGPVSFGQAFTAVGVSSTSASVSSYTPPLGSFALAAVDSSSNQETFTAGSGYNLQATAGGSMADESLSPVIGNTTAPVTLSTAAGWVEVSFWMTPSSPPLLTLNLVPSGASQTTVNGVQGVTIAYTSAMTAPLSASIYLSLSNSAGQVVLVAVQGGPISPGQMVTYFFGLNGIKGGYTASIFAASSQGVVVSTVSTVQVSL